LLFRHKKLLVIFAPAAFYPFFGGDDRVVFQIRAEMAAQLCEVKYISAV